MITVYVKGSGWATVDEGWKDGRGKALRSLLLVTKGIS